MPPCLEVRNISVRYGELLALSDLSLSLGEGETLGLIGANGAGKSTLMRLLCGLHEAEAGDVLIRGEGLVLGDPRASAAAGLALVPEGRLLFESLSIEENLLIGQSDRRGPWSLDAIYDLFPVLVEKRKLPPGALSGGQQQMVAIGRALASNPRILLCDEISLGLSPLVTQDVYRVLKHIRAQGTSLIVVDQDVSRVTAFADRVACMFKGRVTLTGPSAGTERAQIKQAYFGLTA